MQEANTDDRCSPPLMIIEQLIIFNNPRFLLVIMKIMLTFAVKKEDANN